jgi:hypothetical protein
LEKIVNLTGLREEALDRLTRLGHIETSEVERVYIAGVIYGITGDDESPLFQAAQYDLEELGLGKFEFLLSWLSPYHIASSHPGEMADIAMVLMGHKPIPPEVMRQINKVLAEE